MEASPKSTECNDFYDFIFDGNLAKVEDSNFDNIFLVEDIKPVVTKINEFPEAEILNDITKVGRDFVAVGLTPDGLPFIIIQYGSPYP